MSILTLLVVALLALVFLLYSKLSYIQIRMNHAYDLLEQQERIIRCLKSQYLQQSIFAVLSRYREVGGTSLEDLLGSDVWEKLSSQTD